MVSASGNDGARLSSAEAAKLYRIKAPEKTRAAGKKWRTNNPEKVIAKYERHLNRYTVYKDKPCADCGNRFPLECMDFDHREGEVKIGSIGHMIRQHKGHENIVKEIEKCDVVCANCHRIRTRERYMIARKLRLGCIDE